MWLVFPSNRAGSYFRILSHCARFILKNARASGWDYAISLY